MTWKLWRSRGREVSYAASNSTGGSGLFHKQIPRDVDGSTIEGRTLPALASATPDHLLLLVHGLVGTVRDWSYVKDQLAARLGSHFLVYASSSNESFKTFQGVDRAGERLAHEVRQVVEARPGLKHVSMIGHSLGGLIARYAVARLFEAEAEEAAEAAGSPPPLQRQGERPGSLEQRRECTGQAEGSWRGGTLAGGGGKVAGLDPACFITLATPHLGVRGKGQLPFLLGIDAFERLAAPVAPLIVGRTGRQLFLTDGNPLTGRQPLLLRMASPERLSSDLPFLRALGAFHTRVAYANAGYDRMVGWQTASIRRASELPKIPKEPISPAYKHVMLIQNCPAKPLPLPETLSAGEAVDRKQQQQQQQQQQQESFDLLQEKMIEGLQSLAWRKADVSFRDGFFPFFAHNNIHVKLHWLHFDGSGVVRHLVDTIQELETMYMTSRL